jgi:ubiquinone/menaquinone biosynthesis C-methylase UbiE
MTKRDDQPEARVFGCFSVQSVADAYEDIYVPRIFIPWGKRLIEKARLQPGDAVLDVATGPGTVARLGAEQVGPEGRVVGADISPAMIAVATGKPRVPAGAAVEYVVSPAAPLAVPDGAFDVVTCQQGLQFFPDRGAAIAEMHRALKLNGQLVAAVWREIALQPSFAALDAALRECLPAEQAEPYGAPFRWPRGEDLVAALRDGGFSEVVLEELRLPLVYEQGIPQVLATLAASPVSTTIAQLRDEERATLWAAGTRYLTPLVSQGQIRTHMVSNIVSARKG